ncbi:MAG: isochorismatase [Chloroflexi bacterium]|nr:isochorismatase [Chloroflexota bacterium]
MTELPIPVHYQPDRVGEVWRVPYQERAEAAAAWRERHSLNPAAEDTRRVALFLVDVQNTFCIPDYELFVAGRNGMGAVEDNRRLCEFIYRNLGIITHISMTMDTHQAYQIFFPTFLVGANGEHPAAYTLITQDDIQQGRWRFNPSIAGSLGLTPQEGQAHLEYYVAQLTEKARYDLTVWPYHAMLGGLGHALVPSVEEAVFFHSIARFSPPGHIIKGFHPLTEHYSTIGPEVDHDRTGTRLAERDQKLLGLVNEYDAVIITGQAKSHCVAFTIRDLLGALEKTDPALARKVYLLEDCTSPVVVPGVIDYSEDADVAFQSFQRAGMPIIRSTEPIENWSHR